MWSPAVCAANSSRVPAGRSSAVHPRKLASSCRRWSAFGASTASSWVKARRSGAGSSSNDGAQATYRWQRIMTLARRFASSSNEHTVCETGVGDYYSMGAALLLLGLWWRPMV